MKVKLIIEIAGGPKEHIEEVLKGLVTKIQTEQNLIRYKIFEAQEKEKLFFTFSEMEIEFDNFQGLVGFCLDYMPSSIEILEGSVEFKRDEVENVLNDLLAKLHQNDMVLKNLKAELILKKNT